MPIAQQSIDVGPLPLDQLPSTLRDAFRTLTTGGDLRDIPVRVQAFDPNGPTEQHDLAAAGLAAVDAAINALGDDQALHALHWHARISCHANPGHAVIPGVQESNLTVAFQAVDPATLDNPFIDSAAYAEEQAGNQQVDTQVVDTTAGGKAGDGKITDESHIDQTLGDKSLKK